ncbi:pectate lyase [Altericroceibacterium xinjiangense]|uniref:pectate lyase n=1 Tax=Altericroceibacterium xinjiangense TaxID=762261 RepID=UPI000F7E96F7|nr:pectate lyase [Altericroceibacterium xinjiangense]
MNRRQLLGSAAALSLAWQIGPVFAQGAGDEQILQAMQRATRFMTDRVAVNGGYVWSYLPDMSRRWGEMEAKPSMIWIQNPGTAAMGHLFLDAYHATGDEMYYRAAEDVAGALIWGQHPSGGWNYHIDFGGDASARDWYETIGVHGRRLEEFRHYYGNATFDDGGTVDSGKFLLRLYLERRDPKYRAPLDRAVQFVLDAQYPIGGWPQRFPINREYSNGGLPDYTANITFNDEVNANNVEFLVQVYQGLGEERVLDAVRRGMGVVLLAQQGQPQPGWALQYTPALEPAGARTSEPVSLATHTTYASIQQLMQYYRWTGDSKYLARVPEAIAWLEKLELPPERQVNGFTHPTFIEVGTDRALYLNTTGTWTGDARNETVYQPRDGVSWVNRKLDLQKLRDEYRKLAAMPVAEATKGSPLLADNRILLPRYYLVDEQRGSDLNIGDSAGGSNIAALLGSLNAEGYWPTPLRATSHPYRTDPEAALLPPVRAADGELVDPRDTSPFVTNDPVTGISTGTYINNMSALIRALGR